MKPDSLHLILTYACTLECDHCFVWGSPRQTGTMTLADVAHILAEAQALGDVASIYFEGGEAFLYYPLLVRSVDMAVAQGFTAGIVSNAYWATSVADALEWLRPLAGKLVDLSLSSDQYHWSDRLARQVRNAEVAALELGIPVGTISIAQPAATDTISGVGQLPPGESAVMYRGRAADVLSAQAVQHPWDTFTSCPHEDLRNPGRVHVDPLGYVHLCQGIALGNLFETPLREIVAGYDPDQHPVAGPLLAEGPAGLVRRYALPHEARYADACHLCYRARELLRDRFPAVLGPDQMYGVAS